MHTERAGGEREAVDALVVGGGPAGLTAALYLSRLRRRAVLADDGESRALWIDSIHNLPGFPRGPSGAELLAVLREQLAAAGGDTVAARVTTLVPHVDGGWVAQLDGRRIHARAVLLATGVVDELPNLPGITAALKRGLVRQCPICDGPDHAEHRIAVVGEAIDVPHAQREAEFLARFSDRVMLAGLREPRGAATIASRRVRRLASPLARVRRQGEALELVLHDGSLHGVDVIYAALGVTPRSTLGARLGAKRDALGHFIVDMHGRTSVRGLYAAGDVVSGLDQVVVAEGMGAIAATAIHNDLD